MDKGNGGGLPLRELGLIADEDGFVS